MEAETIEQQVRHLVGALGQPRGFDEVVVVVDPFEGPFPRQHGTGDLRALRRRLQGLVADGLVDRIVEGPTDGTEVRHLATRWFGQVATSAHAKNGQAVFAMLKGLESCTGELVLHADADVMIGRPDVHVDHIADAACLFEEVSSAVTLALPVLGDREGPPRFMDDRGPFRVDTQVGWLHRGRLDALRPLPNEVEGGQLELPWHRSLDRVVRAGRACSLRRGSAGLLQIGQLLDQPTGG